MPNSILLFVLLFATTPAQAHVKWFVPAGHSLPADYPVYSWSDPAVQIWLLLACLLVAASCWLDRRLPTPGRPGALGAAVQALLPFGTGLSLLLSAWQGVVLAPHLYWPGTAGTALLLLEGLAGLLLVLPPAVFAGAVLLLCLYTGLLLQAGLVPALEYSNVAAIALYLLLCHWPDAGGRQRLATWSLPLLRSGTGLALVCLAFTEKLLRPDYADDFVSTYMWNFMRNLGLERFGDALFVLSAGTMEAVLGLLLILGTTTRIVVLVISGFMLSSNLTFVLQGHMEEAVTEIIGHLPIICTALILLVFGTPPRSVVQQRPALP